MTPTLLQLVSFALFSFFALFDGFLLWLVLFLNGTSNTELAVIANHPEVRLHFRHDTQRWHFARYYQAQQEQSTELLSLLEMIERYRTMPYEVAR